MSLLSYGFAFVLLLGVLIFVHELGHFLVAKACGVRVLNATPGSALDCFERLAL